MSLPSDINPQLLALSSGYNLTRSLRFRASASAYLNRTMTTPTNNLKWTWSGWVKRGKLSVSDSIFGSAPTGTSYSYLYFATDNTLIYEQYNSGSFTVRVGTTQVFRDPSAWYHIVLVYDSANATSTNRILMYVNGVQVTSFATTTYPSLNLACYINAANVVGIGSLPASYLTDLYDGYLAEVNFIDGQALTPSSFGSTNALTGVWQPARYTGSYGTNGFYLPFTDNSALTTASNAGLGKDFSGNGNYFPTTNISITAGVTYDSMTDVPTLTSATASNFAVLNPLDTSAVTTISNGNLYTYLSASGSAAIRATIASTSGKFYWEVTFGATGDTLMVGVCDASVSIGSALWSGANAWMYYSNNGNKYLAGTATAYGATFTANDVIGVALDLGAGTLVFYKNNTSQGTATSSLAGKNLTATIQSAARALDVYVNFGQRPFTYTPPTGFVALNTYNLPTSTIIKGNKVMDATLYTGNSSTQTVTNAGAFKPDLIWIKNRTSVSQHVLTDSVRGITKQLFSSLTNVEQTAANGVTAINNTGFSLDVNVGPTGSTNSSPDSYVAWQWQAGQGTTSSDTNGSITSTVSVNASAGFSVVTYTGNGTIGATVGHGLGVAPSMIIVKNRGTTSAWSIYHASLGATQAIYFDTSAAGASLEWNNTAPTSSVFSLYSYSAVNQNTGNLVAYCWTPIAGFSAFGSYTGNGSADGPFVYTGFRPKFIMIKNTGYDNNQTWVINDTTRSTYNVDNITLRPNSSTAESTTNGSDLDELSNGFKIRNSNTVTNASGTTIIYAAFAENPFKNSLAR